MREGEHYVEDLKQCVLVFRDGNANGTAEIREIGTVAGVFEGGAGSLLEVRLNEDGRTVLVPYTKEFIGTVDIDAKRIELLQPWILE